MVHFSAPLARPYPVRLGIDRTEANRLIHSMLLLKRFMEHFASVEPFRALS